MFYIFGDQEPPLTIFFQSHFLLVKLKQFLLKEPEDKLQTTSVDIEPPKSKIACLILDLSISTNSWSISHVESSKKPRKTFDSQLFWANVQLEEQETIIFSI